MRRTLAAFTYRDFRVQWIGACTSSIGTWMQIVAQNWLVLSLHRRRAVLPRARRASSSSCRSSCSSLIGGVLADRHDRRRTLLASQYVQMSDLGLAGAADVIFGVVQIWHILGAVVRHRLRAGVRRTGLPVRSFRRSSTEGSARTRSRSTRSSSTSRASSGRSLFGADRCVRSPAGATANRRR